MTYTVEFSLRYTPNLFEIFQQLVTYSIKKYGYLGKEKMYSIIEKEYDVLLKETKDNYNTLYTAHFQSEQDYILFLLRWS